MGDNKKAGCSTGCFTIVLILLLLNKCYKTSSNDKPMHEISTQLITQNNEVITQVTEYLQSPDDLITKSYPADFSDFDSIDCDGITFVVNRLKVCADGSNPKSKYNFYYIVMEYTIENNTSNTVDWHINRSGNIYGTFECRGYERWLGGNRTIKDDDITTKWNNAGTLASGGSSTNSMTLIINRTVDDPDEGLMLRLGTQMKLTLPLHLNGVRWDIDISLNDGS